MFKELFESKKFNVGDILKFKYEPIKTGIQARFPNDIKDGYVWVKITKVKKDFEGTVNVVGLYSKKPANLHADNIKDQKG